MAIDLVEEFQTFILNSPQIQQIWLEHSRSLANLTLFQRPPSTGARLQITSFHGTDLLEDLRTEFGKTRTLPERAGH